MQQLELQELLEVEVGGKSTPDNNKKYLKNFDVKQIENIKKEIIIK